MEYTKTLSLNQKEENGRLMRLASYLSLGLAIILVILKFYAWIQSDSVSLLSSLLDSGLDIGASLVNLLAVRHALMPADREHRFGHGKAEPLAGLIQVTLILGSSLYLFYEVAHRILYPHPVQELDIGIYVLLFAILTTGALVTFQRYVVRKTGSIAISSDSAHYAGDFVINGGAALALILVKQFEWYWADPAIGFAAALYIAYTAIRIGKVSYDMLMDKELDDEERNRIKSIIKNHPAVISIHDLKTRLAGQDYFIQFHLVLDGNITLLQAHHISDEVEGALMKEYPGAEITIHQDPYGIEEYVPKYQ